MNVQTLTSYLKLLACDGLGVVNARKMLDTCNDVSLVFKEEFLEGLSDFKHASALKNMLVNFKNDDIVQEELRFIEKNNIKCVGILDEDYPKLLKECPDAPIMLFYKGNLKILQSDCLAIVGTRKISTYGKDVVRDLINSVVPHKPTIVSGMAYGVDITAYHEARKQNMQVVGVMGTSFKTLYPSAHKKLYHDLFDNGLIITEYAGFNIHVPELFTRRNRIIAGLCKATVVVESAEKGGSLATAYFANDYDRDVYAIPGKITDEFSKGCLRLIHENRAQVLYDFNHLIKDFNWDQPKKVILKEVIKPQIKWDDFSLVQQLILKALSEKSLHIDELALKTNLSMNVLNAELMMLELEDIVIGLPGKIFKLK